MVKTCKTCNKEFKLIEEELAFYEQMGLPQPENCPECRQKRRLSLRNERKFHKYPCKKCGKDMVTTYRPDSGYAVYCLKCYEEFRATVDLTKI